MNVKHVVAVFKAEYYTTTSKFRSVRRYIPFTFLGGVLLFSYLLRIVYEFFRGDEIVTNPPVTTFFSIIAIFSYFTLFAPLLSPLGRVVYDGGARSRREVALNAPVSSKDLLYGNLLSNLAFFLPFFGFIGTLTLAPFIGNGIYSPLVTSVSLFGILSLLILVGLVAGTLLSPMIFNFISQRKSSQTRALVSFGVSAMLVFSLPILRYFLENTTVEGSLGWITYLPFTLAAILIIHVLYGVQIALDPLTALLLLLLYILLIFLLGYFTAKTIYDGQNDTQEFESANPDGMSDRILEKLVAIAPMNYRTIVKSAMKASLRDIEHLSRLTIGLSITIFMIFALSSRGLFRGAANFDTRVELAVIIFALILSSTSVIFIEASSFTVQHRDMFALIKSAPGGARKFVIGKAIQMNLLLIPIFITIIISLSFIGFISASNTFLLTMIVILVMFAMTSLSLAIYLVNPSDNEEDLGNFINLLIFYFLSFAIGIIPVTLVIGEFDISLWIYIVAIAIILSLSVWLLHIAGDALEEMNLETLDSPMSLRIIHYFKVIGLFVISWNILPLFAISYLIATNDPIGFIITTYALILTPVVVYTIRKNISFNRKHLVFPIKSLATYLAIMIVVGGAASFIQTQINPQLSVFNAFSLLPLQPFIILIIISTISLVEELFYRGMILGYASEKLSNRQSNVLTSILFALVHLSSLIGLFNAFIQSLILGDLKQKSNSLLYPIIAHLTYNLVLLSAILLN